MIPLVWEYTHICLFFSLSLSLHACVSHINIHAWIHTHAIHLRALKAKVAIHSSLRMHTHVYMPLLPLGQSGQVVNQPLHMCILEKLRGFKGNITVGPLPLPSRNSGMVSLLSLEK